MEYKADALVLRAADYGENDRMVTLLTAGRGKIGAGMKGVRKAGAKLNFASQPFCFAEYVLAERGGRYTVTQAALHEGFYGLRLDLAKFYAGAGVLETCDAFSAEGMPCGELLVSAVEALSGIETANGAPMSALLSFLLRAVELAGYPVTAGDCAVCGGKMAGRRRFDMASGRFTCAGCGNGVPVSGVTYDAICAAVERRTGRCEGEGHPSCLDGETRAVRLLKAYIAYHTDAELTALTDLLSL